MNEAGELESTQLWHVDQPERYTAFRDLSDRRRLAPGAGVFGHVFTSGQPTWIADLAREHDFVRKAAAEACGIVSAFALPILLSGQVVGVLEFFTTTRSEPDQALLDLLTRIGRQLGRVVERQRAAEQLAASEQRFRSLATFAPVGILQADRQGNCIFVNQRWQELAGLSQGEARGSGWARALHPDDRERVVEAWYAAAQHGQPFAMEYRYQRPDGSISWIFGTATALHTSRGEPEGYLGSLTDISERVHEQESLRQLTTRLAQSNRELQEFAYIASHDLQEPLRKIRTFGDRLNTKYASALGTDGAGYVLRMQSAAARLQDLINDLLTFARIDAKREPFQRVDLNQIASEVVSNLEARISETGGQVTFGQLPQIEANSVQIYQLFQNLIGNALKFARDNVAPHVAISARLLPAAKPNQPSMYELTVADNGIGFDEKYLDRIFTPFQRLHERGKYEGTGMGLAICRRIVEQHHGSITATSIRNQGSTFIIHLPAAQQKEEKGK